MKTLLAFAGAALLLLAALPALAGTFPPQTAEEFFAGCGESCNLMAGSQLPSAGILFRSTGEFSPAGGRFMLWADPAPGNTLPPGFMFIQRSRWSNEAGRFEPTGYFTRELDGSNREPVMFTDPDPLPERRGEEFLYVVAVTTPGGEVLQIGFLRTSVEVVGNRFGRAPYHLDSATITDGMVRVTGIFPERTLLTVAIGSPGGPVYRRFQVMTGLGVTKPVNAISTLVGDDLNLTNFVGRLDVVVEFPFWGHATLPGGLLIAPLPSPGPVALPW